MKQTSSIISTYSADAFGVCSALFELGGMTIIHDASGCNSTYTTHDEPRWYDMDSMFYLTGLSEIEAVMGDEEKTIGDIVTAAKELNPKFIAVTGTPIPMMIGTDFKALASVIEKRTGIKSFGFPTNGMHSYIMGAGMAFEAFADKMTDRNAEKTKNLSANILGFTPLDFSIIGYTDSIKSAVENSGFEVISTWAMNTTLEDMARSGEAGVNLVVSSCGIPAARKLKELYGTPYVIGTPVGTLLTEDILNKMKKSAEDGECRTAVTDCSKTRDTVIIGEGITSLSLAKALELEGGISSEVICAVECAAEDIPAVHAADETEIISAVKNAKRIIADPLYRPICPGNAEFISLPHEAFSGRIYRDNIPDLLKDFGYILNSIKEKVV